MQNVFLINAHEYYPFAEGKLNQALVDRATAHLEARGYTVRHTAMQDAWEVDAEIEKHRWADAILLQTPANWMGVPWSFKKYMDFVYSATNSVLNIRGSRLPFDAAKQLRPLKTHPLWRDSNATLRRAEYADEQEQEEEENKNTT